MRTVSKVLSAMAVIMMAICSCKPDAVEPDKPDKPDPVTPVTPDEPDVPEDCIKLELVSEGSHAVGLSKVTAYSYKVTCDAGDPYFYTTKLADDLAEKYQVIQFEYKITESVSDFQIFYAQGGMASESCSRKYGALIKASDYKTFSADVADFRELGWGKAGDNLRLDPGSDPGPVFFIRNIILRPRTAEEQQAYEDAKAKENFKKQMAENIKKYLAADYPSAVTNVNVTSTDVIIEGKCGSEGEYILADITPWQDVTEMDSFPYAEKISSADFKVTVPRMVRDREGINYDRLFSKWAVVKVDGETQTLDSHARYADEVAAKSSPAPLPLTTKKGIAAGDHSYYFQDIRDMKAGSITMNVSLDNMLSGRGSEFVYGGLGFAAGATRDYVDMILKNVNEMGTVVSAIILCPTGGVFNDPECTGGYYSMPNLTTAEAFRNYAAALEYMASRYNGSGHGRISHWIMHNEVDMGKDWTNMGEQPMMRYLDRYVKSMRICYNIVRQYDQNASILGSYTHNWTQADGEYAPKDMLEKTVEYSEAEGDFLWGVAYHPYAQDLTRPEFWNNDTRSTYSMDSPYVTFKNLEVIDKWIRQKENFYKGEKKRVLFLSEQGTNSPSYSASDLEKQAAGAAWAWKKLQKLDGIDAMQWHNWADNRAEFGLRIGLRAFDAEGFNALQPKPVWYVWKAAGTEEEDEVFAPYLKTIGISDWDSIMHEF